MKKFQLGFLSLCFIFFLSDVNAQEIKSSSSTIVLNNAPQLKIKRVELVDFNKNLKADANESCHFELQVENNGRSEAKTVNISVKIIAGVKEALVFEKSTYIGNVSIGEIKTITIPLDIGIVLKDGVSTFQFIALEGNNYDSNPVDFDVRLIASKIPLGLTWYYPDAITVNTTEKEYNISACILSSEKVQQVKLFLNGKQVSETRGFKLQRTEHCDNFLEEKVNLQKGDNVLYAEVINTKDTFISEKRTIKLGELRYEHRLALIIGNSDYETAPLKNPKNDAAAMATALRDLKFEVIEILDGKKDEMRKGIRDFHTKLKEKKGVGLFYYAGHGLQVKGENFLVPIKHDIQEEYEIPDRTIRVNSILDAMEDCNTRMNIVILDACRDNPFARSMRSTSRGLAQIYAEGSGSIIAYATAPGSTASDGTDGNGLYTQELLKAIKTPGLEIGMVFRRVLTNVKKLSGGKQLPWTNSSIEGEFYFVK